MGQEDYLDELLNSLSNDGEKSDNESDVENSLEIEPEIESAMNNELESTFSEDDLINEFLTNTDAESDLLEDGISDSVLTDDVAEYTEAEPLNEYMFEDNLDNGSDMVLFDDNDSLTEENLADSEVEFQEVNKEFSNEMDSDEGQGSDSDTEDIMAELLEDELDEGNEILEQLDDLESANSIDFETAGLFDLDDLLSDEESKEEAEKNISTENDDVLEEDKDSNEDINLDDLLENFDFSNDDNEASMEELENVDNLSEEQNMILNDLDSILEEADRVEADNIANGVQVNDPIEDDILGDSIDDVLGGLDLGFDADEMNLFADDDLENLLGEDDKNLDNNESMEVTDEEVSKALGDIKNMTSDEIEDGSKKKKGLFSKLFSKKDKDSSESEVSETAEAVIPEEKPKKEKKKKEKKKKEKAKSKKPKREKKPKKEKVVLPPEPWVGVSKGKVISIILLMGSMIAFALVCVEFLPYNLSMSNAHDYYEHQEYSEAYEAMIGLEINESDLDFFYKVQNIMFLQSKYDEYQTYTRLDKKYEALSALIRAVEKYDIHIEEANIYGAAPVYSEVYEKVEKALQDDFGVTVDEARNIYVSETSADYSRAIYDILGYEEVTEE